VTRKRPLGRRLIVSQTRTTRRYHFDNSHPASKPGGLGPTRSQPGCGCRRAASRPWRNGGSDPSGGPARGRCDSPTAAHPRAASPGSPHPRSPRPRAPGGPRHRPGATASRTTPVAQPGRGRDSPPAAHPRAAVSQPRSTPGRLRAQPDRNLLRRNGDSERTGRPVGGGSDPLPAAQPRATASHPWSIRPRAQASRSPPPAQRRPGTHRSPSRRRQRPSAGGPTQASRTVQGLADP
jgi:hypothetical protein